MKSFFITATDTDAGKTHIASALIRKLVDIDNKVAAYKPISAGCDEIKGELINQDAKQLHQEANCSQTLKQVNPIAFKEPIAPHIAAATLNKELSVAEINQHYHSIKDTQPDIIITEGAGGWRLPLGSGCFLSEFAIETQQQVILIVNMKLGCLNHAILTYQAIVNDGLECVGWVANSYQPMDYLSENIKELTSLLPIPILGSIPFEADLSKVAAKLDLTALSL